MKKWFSNHFSDVLKWSLTLLLAYIFIQVVDQYEKVFFWGKEILTSLYPFLLSFLFAYLLNPIVKRFEKKLHLSRGKSVLFTYLLIFLAMTLVGWWIGPLLYNNTMDLIKQTPNYATEVTNWLAQLDFNLTQLGGDFFEPIKEELLKVVPQTMNILADSLTNIVSFTMGVMSVTGNVVLAVFISIYVLLTKEDFFSMTKKISSLIIGFERTHRVGDVLHLMHVNIGKYLVGKLICSLFVGVFCTLGLVIFKGKYAVLLGVVYGMTNMVPLFGPIVGTIIITVIQCFVNPATALFILIYLFVVQQVETLVIDPKFAGKNVGLTPFFTILGVMLGGAIGGVVGMILGVPMLGVIKTYLLPFINHHYEARLNEIDAIADPSEEPNH